MRFAPRLYVMARSFFKFAAGPRGAPEAPANAAGVSISRPPQSRRLPAAPPSSTFHVAGVHRRLDDSAAAEPIAAVGDAFEGIASAADMAVSLPTACRARAESNICFRALRFRMA